MFEQDNVLPHVTRDMVPCPDQHDVEVMGWPAMRPDMNPIDYVWDKISIWIRDMDRPPSNLAELCQAVRQACRAVRERRVGTLVESMPHPHRVRVVLASRGRHMLY